MGRGIFEEKLTNLVSDWSWEKAGIVKMIIWETEKNDCPNEKN